ncbi:MAG: hypothetical protein EGR50_02660, partial [Alistipes communis]|nr:hypothetical protein [Alistipes communis]
EGNFEMGCAAAALRLRGEGLKIKLHIAVTRGKSISSCMNSGTFRLQAAATCFSKDYGAAAKAGR